MEPLSARPYGRAMLTIVPIDELAKRGDVTVRRADRPRVPAPLRVGESVRMRGTLAALDRIPGSKPVCVATAIYRIFE